MNTLKQPLVNVLEVQETCGLSKNVDSKEYDKFILTAQNTRLRGVLNDAFIDAVITYRFTPSAEVNTDYDYILERFIEPFLCHESFSRYIPTSNLKSVRSGVKKTQGEGLEDAGTKEINALIGLHQKDAETFLESLICYLDENKSAFPLYESKNEPLEDHSIFTLR